MEYMGYKFCVRRRTGEFIYYFCSKKARFHCPASIRQNVNNGIITIIRNHNDHDRNAMEDRISRFRDVLVHRAITETTRVRNIYDEEAARNPEVAVIYTYPTAQSTMTSARKRHNPPIPNTLEDLGHLLQDPAWGDKFFCSITEVPEPFMQRSVLSEDGVALLFASQTLIDRVVGGVEEVHLDGTFKCIPAAPPSYQLLTIHFVAYDKTIAVAYALMSNKRQALYCQVLEQFLLLAPTLQPRLIVTDYETGLRGALSSLFPQAEVVGCWFHYANAVWKMAVRLGYARHEQMNEKKAIKMLMALPLLPAGQFVEGLHSIQHWINAHGINMNNMFAYMERYWIRTVRPKHISVFMLPRRTNNNVEAYNKILITKMGVHPNVYKFLESLIQLTVRSSVEYESLRQGRRISRPMGSRYRRNDVNISNAQLALRNGTHTVFHFLEIVSHSVENLANDLRQEYQLGFVVDIIDDVPVPAAQNDDVAAAEPALEDVREPIIDPGGVGEPAVAEANAPVEQPVVPQLPNNRTCNVCLDAPRTHACLPCGHFIMCERCANEIVRLRQHCPVCRQDVNSITRIYF